MLYILEMSFESPIEKALRKLFLKYNQTLDEKRAASYSMCFVNMHFYRNSYPPSVEEKVCL